MNPGGPATPLPGLPGLRALRHEPSLVDDLALEARLASVGAATEGADAESVRWTRAWLVVWQGVLHAAGAIGTAPPWSVPVPLDDVPGLKGDPARARRARALDLLARTGLLHPGPGAGAARLDEALFTVHRAGLEVDWDAACRACRYEPAALLVLRSLVEVVVPADAPTPVSLRELAGRTGYAEKQVRLALRRLVESGVVASSETPGQASRYALTPATLGRAVPGRAAPPPELAPPTAPAAPVVPQRPLAAPVAAAPAAPAAPAPAVRLAVNGVTLAVAAGLSLDVTLDPDGLPRVTVRPAD